MIIVPIKIPSAHKQRELLFNLFFVDSYSYKMRFEILKIICVFH